MVNQIEIDFFLNSPIPLIDVRSPGEYSRGHIPGAVNIPLFSDEERAKVGTVYAKQSQEQAVKLGMLLVQPKLGSFIEEARKTAPGLHAAVHCWRGGMRSQAFAHHLSENGFSEVLLIKGGYKSYRSLIFDLFNQTVPLRIIGGYTGSGKTDIIHHLEKSGEQVIDLEALACHRGSAFGGIGQPLQPTTEQFENNLFELWRNFNFSKIIWLEDESQNIGKVNIPSPIFSRMKQSVLYFVKVPKEQRIERLVSEYAQLDPLALAYSINQINRRLGGDTVQLALKNLESGNFHKVASLVLHYYDKWYLKSLENHVPEQVHTIETHIFNPETIANTILEHEYKR